MNTQNTTSPPKTTSIYSTLVALIPFITFGLTLIFNELPFEWMLPDWAYFLMGYLIIGTFIISTLGFLIGWLQGFPRWSYPYVGLILIFSLYLMRQPMPVLISGKGLLEWRAWIPLLTVSIVALLVTRSLHPLKQFFGNISQDWTLLTFGMFSFLPLAIAVIFDEMDRLYSLYFMLSLTLLIWVTVIIYMQSSSQKGRAITLAIGILFVIIIAVAGPAWYWYDRMQANPWPVIIAGILVYLFLFVPALSGIFRITDSST